MRKVTRSGLLILPCVVSMLSCVSQPTAKGGGEETKLPVVYVANPNGNSLSAFQMNTSTGAVKPIPGTPLACGELPSLPFIEPLGRYLYVLNLAGGSISGFSIDHASGKLKPLAGSPFPSGKFPLSLQGDPSGKYLYTACAGSGEIISYRITGDNGALVPVSKISVQGGDSGLFLAAGSRGRLVFVSNGNDGSILALKADAQTGSLLPGGRVLLPESARPMIMAALPSEKVLYVAQQAPDAILAYAIDPVTAALTPIAGSPFRTGRVPHSIAVNPSGTVAYVGCNGEIWAYQIDASSGALSATETIKSKDPVWLVVYSSGKLLLVSDDVANSISAYQIDASKGALTLTLSSPTSFKPLGFAVGTAASAVAPNRPATFLAFVAGAVAPVSISVPQGTNDYYVKFERADQSALVVTGYIRAGETLKGSLPTGTYTLKYAAGSEWEGPDSLFGPNTLLYKTNEKLLFKTEGSTALGHAISLIRQQGGNLESERITLDEF